MKTVIITIDRKTGQRIKVKQHAYEGDAEAKRNEQIEVLSYGMMEEIRSDPTGFNNRVREHWKKVNGTKEAG